VLSASFSCHVGRPADDTGNAGFNHAESAKRAEMNRRVAESTVAPGKRLDSDMQPYLSSIFFLFISYLFVIQSNGIWV
jgi:hypothetical protein